MRRPEPLRVAGLAVAAVLWTAACGSGGNGPPPSAETSTESPVATAREAVDAYVKFAGGLEGGGTALDANAIAEGLRLLAGALGSLGIGTPELAVDLRVSAEHLLLNAESTAARPAIVEAATAIGMRAGAGAAQVRQAAEAVKPDVPLVQQEEPLRAFFARSRSVLASLPAA